MSKKRVMAAIRKNIEFGFYHTDGRLELERVREACRLNGISFDDFLNFNHKEEKRD